MEPLELLGASPLLTICKEQTVENALSQLSSIQVYMRRNKPRIYKPINLQNSVTNWSSRNNIHSNQARTISGKKIQSKAQ